jgi:hypothetical protein
MSKSMMDLTELLERVENDREHEGNAFQLGCQLGG